VHRPTHALLIALAALTAPAAAQETRGSWILKARLVVPVEGAPIEKGAIRISGTKIDAIGPAAGSAGAAEQHVVDLPDGIVYPGLVDAGSWQGIRRERDDGARPFQPTHRIFEAFDPLNPSFAKNFAAGVTTVHLVPGNAAVAGGRTAVVKVGPDGAFRALSPDAGLKLSLVEDAYPENRSPTSLIGALGAIKDPADERLAADLLPFRSGAKTTFVAASTNREVLAALGLRALGFRTVLVADLSCGRFANDVKEGTTGVILDSLSLSRQPFEWAQLSDLFRTGTPIAFATWAPFKSPGALRLNAAIAARRGLPQDAVLRALTIDAAKILGVDQSVGSLKAGKDADLVVLSAPIEDARARVLLCVQDGKIVYRAPKEPS
jgi:imidazolonepropionase-like amidohydrolase